jgi:hypothetical protein
MNTVSKKYSLTTTMSLTQGKRPAIEKLLQSSGATLQTYKDQVIFEKNEVDKR